jgi:acid phosphatase
MKRITLAVCSFSAAVLAACGSPDTSGPDTSGTGSSSSGGTSSGGTSSGGTSSGGTSSGATSSGATSSGGGSSSGGSSSTSSSGGTTGSGSFNHVVIVVEENENLSDVLPSGMAYLNSLATTYAQATQYYANTHPSIGNYEMMTTGHVLSNDDNQDPSSLPISDDNVVRELLAAGKTWKAYAEDLPSVGYVGGDSGNYAVRHNPLAYLTDAQKSATQKQNLVPFTQFSVDLANNALPNYSFVVPNLCNDAHDCSIATADKWLQSNIAPLVNDPNFQKDGLLLIVFDEASDSDSTHGGGRIPLVVVTPRAKKGFQSTTLYQHEALCRLSLQALGVKTWPGAAATAPSMSEFFVAPLP